MDPRLRTQAKAFAKHLEAALLYADVRTAETIARDAVAAGMPTGLIGDAVVRPAMARIGDRWARARSPWARSTWPRRSCCGCWCCCGRSRPCPSGAGTRASCWRRSKGNATWWASRWRPTCSRTPAFGCFSRELTCHSRASPRFWTTTSPTWWPSARPCPAASCRSTRRCGWPGKRASRGRWRAGLRSSGSHPIPGLHISDSVQAVVQAADTLLRRAALN